MSLRHFVSEDQKRYKCECAATVALKKVQSDMPDLAEKYFDIRFDDYKKQ